MTPLAAVLQPLLQSPNSFACFFVVYSDCSSLRSLCATPLAALCAEYCVQLPRSDALVEGSLGFDVSRHPDADSKVAREMQATPKPREIGFKSKQDLLREAREKAAGK